MPQEFCPRFELERLPCQLDGVCGPRGWESARRRARRAQRAVRVRTFDSAFVTLQRLSAPDSARPLRAGLSHGRSHTGRLLLATRPALHAPTPPAAPRGAARGRARRPNGRGDSPTPLEAPPLEPFARCALQRAPTALVGGVRLLLDDLGAGRLAGRTLEPRALRPRGRPVSSAPHVPRRRAARAWPWARAAAWRSFSRRRASEAGQTLGSVVVNGFGQRGWVGTYLVVETVDAARQLHEPRPEVLRQVRVTKCQRAESRPLRTSGRIRSRPGRMRSRAGGQRDPSGLAGAHAILDVPELLVYLQGVEAGEARRVRGERGAAPKREGPGAARAARRGRGRASTSRR
jgi:hypothetical protein